MNTISDPSRPGGTRKPCILVVDDDGVTLCALTGGLQAMGYETMEATSGEDALRQLIAVRPDFAIIDINMPGISGFELAQRLRELGEIPFLFLSADGRSESVREANRHGAIAYLVKPLSVQQLVPAVEIGVARAAEVCALHERQSVLAGSFDAARDTNQAIGVLMERFKLDRQRAFETLRSRARAERRKINAVAFDVLSVKTMSSAMAP